MSKSYEARDEFGNLICPHPNCKTVIRALTGLQEIQKLQAHWNKKHGSMSMNDALEVRALHEDMADDKK